jgi:hypothetical protein
LSLVCAGIKRNGGRCTVSVESGQTFCHHHDPARAEERRLAASRAGRAKPNREIVGIRVRLTGLADDVLAGRVDRADAAVAGQLLGTAIRCLETERKWRELGEVEERLALLEERASTGSRRAAR